MERPQNQGKVFWVLGTRQGWGLGVALGYGWVMGGEVRYGDHGAASFLFLFKLIL